MPLFFLYIGPGGIPHGPKEALRPTRRAHRSGENAVFITTEAKTPAVHKDSGRFAPQPNATPAIKKARVSRKKYRISFQTYFTQRS